MTSLLVFFSTFCLTDRGGRCLAVNLYNLAPGRGVIIGDTVAIAEPKFSRVRVEHKNQVGVAGSKPGSRIEALQCFQKLT